MRRDIYPAFLYGGNGQRYTFIPVGEIWIDHDISCEEFRYTVAHELRERALMARKGLTYADAHDSALAAERSMRLADQDAAQSHELAMHKVSPRDCDGDKEIATLADSVELHGVYRAPLGTRDSIAIWIVDGARVRRDLFPDFGLSGNDRAYHFIPAREIWIDGQISCEETEFSIVAELLERGLMMKGMSYDDAYEEALKDVLVMRRNESRAALHMPAVRLPRALDRDAGTGDEPTP